MTEDNPIILLAGETDEDLVPIRSPQVDFGRVPQSAVILVNYIGSWDSQARNAFGLCCQHLGNTNHIECPHPR